MMASGLNSSAQQTSLDNPSSPNDGIQSGPPSGTINSTATMDRAPRIHKRKASRDLQTNREAPPPPSQDWAIPTSAVEGDQHRDEDQGTVHEDTGKHDYLYLAGNDEKCTDESQETNSTEPEELTTEISSEDHAILAAPESQLTEDIINQRNFLPLKELGQIKFASHLRPKTSMQTQGKAPVSKPRHVSWATPPTTSKALSGPSQSEKGLPVDFVAAQTYQTNMPPVFEVPRCPPATAEQILERHWRDLKRLAPDAGYRSSPLRRFFNSVQDVNVSMIAFDNSLQCPMILPAICRQIMETRYHVGMQWVKEVNFVFTEEIFGSRAEQERDNFWTFLSYLYLESDDSYTNVGPHNVHRMSIPGYSRNPKTYSEFLMRFKNLEQIVLGIRASDSLDLSPQEWVNRYHLQHVIKAPKLTKVTIVKGADSNPAPKKVKAKYPQTALDTRPREVNQWFEQFGSHLKALRGNPQIRVFLDLNDRWGGEERAHPEEVKGAFFS